MLFTSFNGQLTAIWLFTCLSWCSGWNNVLANETAWSPKPSNPRTTAIPRSGWEFMRPRNDHDEIKALINHVVDGVLQKIDVNQAIYMNELSSMADVITGSFSRSLHELNARMQTLDMLSHQIDELTDYKNNVDIKLFRMNDNTETNQMLNVRLNDLQQNVDHLRTQMDHIIERNVQATKRMDNKMSSPSTRDAEIVDAEATFASGEQNAANCESKIDQVISFVHNFAEINRLESSDILNRLSNMQTQLIHFFDADKITTKSHIHLNSREKIPRNRTESIQASTEQILINSSVLVSTSLNNNATHFSDENNSTTSIDVPLMENSIFSDHVQMKGNSISPNDAHWKNFTPPLDNAIHKKSHFLDHVLLSQMPASPFHVSQIEHSSFQDDNKSRMERSISGKSPLQFSAHRSAKYGVPTNFGCHRMESSMRTNGLYRFDAIDSNRNSAGRNFNDRVCSFDSSDAGWTVIQRRGQQFHTYGPENFNRSWNDYKYGFGDLSGGEFWFGNDFIHKLTYDDDMELKIVLENWSNQRIDFNFDIFRVDSEENKYNLMIDGFQGANKSLDAMAYHRGQDFSTFDRQHDRTGIDGNRECCSCAISYASGWWFNNCLEANLNGVYRTQPNGNNYVGIVWEHWMGDYSLKSTQMMIRPKVEWNNDTDGNDMDSNSRPPEDP